MPFCPKKRWFRTTSNNFKSANDPKRSKFRECAWNPKLSFNHNIVDGAPAACFTARLKELADSGYGLIPEQEAQSHEVLFCEASG